MDNITFPTITVSLGLIIDNFLPNATPYADIDYELANVIGRARNLGLLAHIQKVDERHYRLWRIEDWNAIEEIRRAKKKEQEANREANIVLSEKFIEVRDRMAKKFGPEVAHTFATALFSASDERAREGMATVLGTTLDDVKHLFDNKPVSYEIVVSYKGKTLRLW